MNEMPTQEWINPMRRSKRNWTAAPIAGLLLLTLLTACGGDAPGGTPETAADATAPATGDTDTTGDAADFESHELRMESPIGRDDSWTQIMDRFAEGVAEATGGAVQIEVFADAELSRDTVTQFENIQNGTIDGSVVNNQPLAGFDERLNVYSLPFLATTAEEYFAMLDGPGRDLWEEAFDNLGVAGIPEASTMQGFRQLTTASTPVRGIGDLEGLTIRTPGLPLYVDIFEGLGANPTSMPFGELAGALQQGVVDGQENPLSIIQAGGLAEFQGYLTLWNYSNSAMAFAFNADTWDELGPELQEVFRQEALEATAWHRENIVSIDEEVLEEFRSMDAFDEIIEFSQEDYAAFQEEVQPIYDEWTERLGEDVVGPFLPSN